MGMEWEMRGQCSGTVHRSPGHLAKNNKDKKK